MSHQFLHEKTPVEYPSCRWICKITVSNCKNDWIPLCANNDKKLVNWINHIINDIQFGALVTKTVVTTFINVHADDSAFNFNSSCATQRRPDSSDSTKSIRKKNGLNEIDKKRRISNEKQNMQSCIHCHRRIVVLCQPLLRLSWNHKWFWVEYSFSLDSVRFRSCRQVVNN